MTTLFCTVHLRESIDTSKNAAKATYTKRLIFMQCIVIVQELCESRGGRPGLSVLTSLLVSVDVKLY